MDESERKLWIIGEELAPADWAAAIREQWSRVQKERVLIWAAADGKVEFDQGMEASRRLRFEGHFLVAAIRQLLRSQEAHLRVTGDQRLRDARAAFDAAVPDAKDFRDFLEHLDEYALGTGKLQRSGDVSEEPNFAIVATRPGGPVRLQFDERELDLGEAAEAALRLADVTQQVWSDSLTAFLKS